jgi:hypothetical protein
VQKAVHLSRARNFFNLLSWNQEVCKALRWIRLDQLDIYVLWLFEEIAFRLLLRLSLNWERPFLIVNSEPLKLPAGLNRREDKRYFIGFFF